MKNGPSQQKILARLKESEELYKTLVSNLIYPIIIHQDGKVVFANDMVLEFAGYTEEEIVGKDLADIFKDPLDNENIENLYKLFIDPDVTEEQIEIRTESRKVMLHTFLLRNNRIRYRGKEAVMSILFDITNRVQLEKYIIDKVIETEEKDRKQFAADLHDDLGPTLSAIKIHLGLIGEAYDNNRLKDTLMICTSLLNEAISKMRIISNNLMPRLIEDYGLEAALNSFIKTVHREDIFSVNFTSDLGETRFPKTLELHIYRIITELINNTIKHAGATAAALKLNYAGNALKLTYCDNGKGYEVGESAGRPSGMGIGNILNRVNLIDGKITFTKKNGKTEVRIVKLFTQ
jgi:PAS domain S-box-containing protein